MRQIENDMAASGVVAGIMIFVIVAVGSLGFLMISDAFNTQYNGAIQDPVNSTGIMLNNTSSYEGVKVITTAVSNSIPAAILVAFLLAVILIVLLVWAILKKGD